MEKNLNEEVTELLEPADFEKAIKAAKWGKFHIMMYVIAITCGWSSIFETTTMSYVFPAAECDLKLKLEHKGMLNAVTYAGMISTGFLWGYLCDTLGRKKLLIVGYLLDSIFVLLSAFSQSFEMLMVMKFFGGALINGPFSAITAYLSEIHRSSQRSKAQFLMGVIYSMGTLAMPLLAIYILPLKIHIDISENSVLHSWNMYLLICAAIPFTSAIAFMFLPESPKFYMTVGKNENALRVFRKIYSINTGKDPETYPIKNLVNEIELNVGNKFGNVTANRTKSQAVLEGWHQMQPLFRSPYLKRIILVCIIQGFTMNSLNTLRLWLPQIFQAMNDYKVNYHTSGTLCDALEIFQGNKTGKAEFAQCVVNTNNISVYTNSIIVCAVTILFYILSGSVVNKIGKKKLSIILTSIGGLSVIALSYSRNTITILTLASIFVGTGSVMINNVLAIIVDMFPTTLRTMAVSLAMITGRMGALFGNILYPVLLHTGCSPAFLYNGSLTISAALLVLLLPITNLAALT